MNRSAGSLVLSLATLTLAARVVGFGRSLVFSKTVGDTCLGDAYNVANAAPNILFEIVAGGVLAGVVVPVVARHVAAGRRDETAQTVSALLTWTLVVLTPAALLALFGAPLYGRLFASTACAGSAGTVAALLLAFAPQVWLYGLAVVSAGVLQAHSRFLAAALAPLLSSVVVIAAYLAYAAVAPAASRDDLAALTTRAAAALGWGTTLGVLVLAGCTLLPLARLGVRLRPRLRFAEGDSSVIVRIAAAGIVGLVLQQLSVLLISWATQHSGDAGALTRFTWANALYLLPYAVLVAPLLQLAFPRLTAAAAADPSTLGRTLSQVVPPVVALAWLGAALLAATAVPVARVFVLGPGSGRTAALAGPVAAFAPAVVGFALLGLASRTLLAQHRARDSGLATGAGWASVIVAVAVLRLVLPSTALVTGVAAGVSAGMVVGAVVGWSRLRHGVPGPLGLGRPLLTGGVSAVVAVALLAWPAGRLADSGLGVALLGGVGVAGACTAVFLAVLALLDRPLLRTLWALRTGSRPSTGSGSGGTGSGAVGQAQGTWRWTVRIAEVLGASTGGIGRHVASLAPRLAAQGHEVTVYAPPTTALAHDFGGVPVAALRHLREVRDADVVHAHGYQAAARVLPWARLGRVPLVVTWHNAILGTGRHALAGRLLQQLVARGADLTLGASSDLVETALARGARRAELGPVAAPALPTAATPRAAYRASLGLADTDLLLVTVGRLAPQKNLGMVLDLAAELRRDPRLQLVIAGDGPLHDELTARIDAEQLPVRLLGRVGDVGSLLGAADGVLLTSTWEARALVAQEALLAGVPLFSTRVGGIPELVGDAAVLFALDDVAGAAAAIEATLSDPARRTALREAGRAQAAGWPDEDRVAADLEATYAALVTEHAAGHSTRGRRPT